MKDNSKKIAACSIHNKRRIVGFFGEYRFLSNFHKCEIKYKGRVFHSTEAAYMSEKCNIEEVKDRFAGELEPKIAKGMGRMVPLREDWEEIKDQVMYEVNLIKYTNHEDLKQMLLATGKRHLEEGNWWGDVYWGTCDGIGRNQLGITLMRIRSELSSY